MGIKLTSGSYRWQSSHWGAFEARFRGDGLDIRAFAKDPAPSPIVENIAASLDHPCRLSTPLIRQGWLEDGPGPDDRRGTDSYVPVDWPTALDLAAGELRRLNAGPEAGRRPSIAGKHVFGGSYGWSSAGRFHHAQSLVHRFLNATFGGYVRSVDTYSSAAGSVILEMVWGDQLALMREWNVWGEIADHTNLLIAIGGIPSRNLQVSPGGITQHMTAKQLSQASDRGCQIVSVSPLRDDFDCPVPSRWLPVRPSTDTALMLGMAHRLIETGTVDLAYLEAYTVGYQRFRDYVTGAADQIPKSPEWAAAICGIPAEDIRDLADRAARERTHICVTYSVQRAQHGEQPVWMALTLASMLGHARHPGGGFSYSISSMGNVGKAPLEVPLPTMPQGTNAVEEFIPVARISEMLLNPGGQFTYMGKAHTYNHIRLVYWAGGNPFHHHQDLSRLRKAFSRPDTIIVHDCVGTSTAAHADIVFPATIPSEREDIGAAGNDPFMVPMQRLKAPLEGARDDYDIFADLAGLLGCRDAFTEGRSSREWLKHIYERTRTNLASRDLAAPSIDEFLDGQIVELPTRDSPGTLQRFHASPATNPLPNPAGRIQIYSEAVAATGLPGHPAWIEPEEWLGSKQADRHPFQLIANQPKGRLHSQLDFGSTSMAGKQMGRETARMNPIDAARLGISDGDVVRIWNDRGGTLAAVKLSDDLIEAVVQLPTGAWWAPVDLPDVGRTCVNGNPNAVTSDRGASPLSQGCAGQLSLVSVEKWAGSVPSVIPHADIMPCLR